MNKFFLVIIICILAIITACPSPSGRHAQLTVIFDNSTVTANGEILSSGEPKSILLDTNVTLEITPDTGYVFDGWSGDISGTDNPYTFLMDEDKNIDVNISIDDTPKHELIVSFNNATITANGIELITNQPQLFNEDSSVELNVIPNQGYVFEGWDGDLTGTDNPATIIMDGDKSIIANIEVDSSGTNYELTVTFENTEITANGTSLTSGLPELFPENTDVILEVIPNPGFIFVGWGGLDAQDVSDTEPYTITMDSDKSLIAETSISDVLDLNVWTQSTITTGNDSHWLEFNAEVGKSYRLTSSDSYWSNPNQPTPIDPASNFDNEIGLYHSQSGTDFYNYENLSTQPSDGQQDISSSPQYIEIIAQETPIYARITEFGSIDPVTQDSISYIFIYTTNAVIEGTSNNGSFTGTDEFGEYFYDDSVTITATASTPGDVPTFTTTPSTNGTVSNTINPDEWTYTFDMISQDVTVNVSFDAPVADFALYDPSNTEVTNNGTYTNSSPAAIDGLTYNMSFTIKNEGLGSIIELTGSEIVAEDPSSVNPDMFEVSTQPDNTNLDSTNTIAETQYILTFTASDVQGTYSAIYNIEYDTTGDSVTDATFTYTIEITTQDLGFIETFEDTNGMGTLFDNEEWNNLYYSPTPATPFVPTTKAVITNNDVYDGNYSLEFIDSAIYSTIAKVIDVNIGTGGALLTFDYKALRDSQFSSAEFRLYDNNDNPGGYNYPGDWNNDTWGSWESASYNLSEGNHELMFLYYNSADTSNAAYLDNVIISGDVTIIQPTSELSLADSNGEIIDDLSSPINLGTVDINTDKVTDFYLVATDKGNVTINNINFTDNGSGEFTFDDSSVTYPLIIEGGLQQPFIQADGTALVFNSSTEGTFTCNFSVNHDADNPVGSLDFSFTIDANAPLFKEDFEGDGSWGGLGSGHNWIQVYESGGSGGSNLDWTFTGTDPYEGSYAAYFPYSSGDGDITKLVSPAIDFSSIASPATLTLFLKQVSFMGNWDYLKVFYTTTDPVTGPWIELADYSSSPYSDYTEMTVNLTGSAGESTYYVAFEGTSNDNYGVKLDYIKIEE